MKQKWYPNEIFLSMQDFNQNIQIDTHQIHNQVLRYHLEDTQAEVVTLIRESVNSTSDIKHSEAEEHTLGSEALRSDQSEETLKTISNKHLSEETKHLLNRDSDVRTR